MTEPVSTASTHRQNKIFCVTELAPVLVCLVCVTDLCHRVPRLACATDCLVRLILVHFMPRLCSGSAVRIVFQYTQSGLYNSAVCQLSYILCIRVQYWSTCPGLLKYFIFSLPEVSGRHSYCLLCQSLEALVFTGDDKITIFWLRTIFNLAMNLT